jgi:PAT family beta-lactamase induction signal transducer AmpG
MNSLRLIFQIKNSYKTLLYYLQPPFLGLFILGTCCGIPFLLILSTLTFWLGECGASKTTRGLFILVTAPYSLKFLWAHYLDQKEILKLTKHLGLRRSWTLISQVFLILTIFLLGMTDPSVSLIPTFISALAVAFFSATQEITVHAYRIENLKEKDAAAGAAIQSAGFHLGMFISGILALYLAHEIGWKFTYWLLALGILFGVFAIFIVPESQKQAFGKDENSAQFQKKHIKIKFLQSFKQLTHQFPTQTTLISLLIFIFFFKLIDTVINAMPSIFLPDIGYNKIEYADVNKYLGNPVMILGDFIGGILIGKAGIFKALIASSSLQTIACLLFSLLSLISHNLELLSLIIAIKSFSSGLAATTLLTYVSSFCKGQHTASNFTILWTFASIVRILTSVSFGALADYVSWAILFTSTSFCFIPLIFFEKKLKTN